MYVVEGVCTEKRRAVLQLRTELRKAMDILTVLVDESLEGTEELIDGFQKLRAPRADRTARRIRGIGCDVGTEFWTQ